jgi:hypothetical protein
MKVHHILDIAKAYAEQRGAKVALSRMEDIQWAPEYAEPGYSTDKWCILFGNWNKLDRWNPETKTHDLILPDSEIWTRTIRLLEKKAELEWGDEWSTCSECSRAVRTQADSYCWQPSYWMGDGELLCLECAAKNPEDVLLSFEDAPNKGLSPSLGIDPAAHGYWLAQDEFENGWYGGQDADPKAIAKTLHAKGIDRFLFRIDSVGQFDLRFSLFLHESEKSKWEATLEGQLSHDEYRAKEDPKDVLDRGLRAAATTPAPPGEGVIVTKIKDDGTAETKRVSPEDFIAGKALD